MTHPNDLRTDIPCSQQGCAEPGATVYDFYGIYAGRWCRAHESNAPGQWAYDGPDTEPLEEA